MLVVRLLSAYNMSLGSSEITEEIRKSASLVRLLALDSDGVLTDGGVYLMDDGREFRRFDIKDGLGLKRIKEIGIQVAIVSGAACDSVVHRAHQLGIVEVFVAVPDKLATLKEICQRLDISLSQVAYIGDDLPDLPVLKCVGFPCAPCDACKEVKTVAKFVSSMRGGYGAVREVCDLIFPFPAVPSPFVEFNG